MGRILILFVRRLWPPLVVLAGSLGICVVVYMRLEGVRPLDALFWVTHSHSIDSKLVRKSTKVFALLWD